MMKMKTVASLCLSAAMLQIPAYAAGTPGDALNQMISDVESQYYKTVDRNLLAERALKGALTALDQHSMYFNAAEYQEFTNSVEGKYVGIGILVGEDEKYVKILKVYPNSPAQLGGVLAGDILTAVDGQDLSTLSYQQRIDRILGKENTSVTITLLRGQTKVTKSLVRKMIERSPVEYKVLEGGIGYIQLQEFTSTSAKYFNEALVALKKQKIKGLVLDLRDDPGGLIDQVLLIAENFVPAKTPMVYVKTRYGEDIYTSEGQALGLPLAVLVNENSASGSEMLSGIIKDNKVGTLVGTKTYGKGTAQNLFPLSQAPGGGYKLTIAEFFTTGHVSFNGKGIQPDIQVDAVPVFSQETLNALVPLADVKPVKVGDAGLNVYAVEQRLELMGRTDVKPDGIYDEALNKILVQLNVDTDKVLTQADAQAFQKQLLGNSKNVTDVQLSKALEIVQSKIK